MDEYYDEVEHEPIEGYCMRCRDHVEIEEAQPVWTRKGMPATRGECPICGGTVFRMGKTDLHDEANRPEAVHIGGSEKRNRPKLARDTVYLTYDPADEELAQQLAADLDKIGIAVWLHEHEGDSVNWAGGVHPALKECARMVYILSPKALKSEEVIQSWTFFREQRKPIVIAQVKAQIDPPDAIRRSPRFDFTGDYKTAFRQMVQALSS